MRAHEEVHGLFVYVCMHFFCIHSQMCMCENVCFSCWWLHVLGEDRQNWMMMKNTLVTVARESPAMEIAQGSINPDAFEAASAAISATWRHACALKPSIIFCWSLLICPFVNRFRTVGSLVHHIFQFLTKCPPFVTDRPDVTNKLVTFPILK